MSDDNGTAATKYEAIIVKALREAEKVKAPFKDFVQGLHDMKAALEERIDSAEYELRQSGEDDDDF